jgi:16S rRNA (cytidine1402-2'-O)-methyltransferase
MAQGRLHVVATPIGNLGDFSARAVETLQNANLIAAEDTRHSGVLLKHFSIDTKLISYHEHNEDARAEDLIAKLLDGDDIALITDAGTPCISDPGYRIVRAARAAGIEVVSVPGPSSPIAALSISGLPSDTFTFHGFFPKKAAQVERILASLADAGGTHIFLESPKRILATIEAIESDLANAEVSLVREMTKIHEEVMTGTAGEVLSALDGRAIKGECVLVVHVPVSAPQLSDQELRARVETVMTQNNLSQRDAVKAVAKETGIPKNRVYTAAIADDD